MTWSDVEETSTIAKEMEMMSDEVTHQFDALTGIADELRNSSTGYKTRSNGDKPWNERI